VPFPWPRLSTQSESISHFVPGRVLRYDDQKDGDTDGVELSADAAAVGALVSPPTGGVVTNASTGQLPTSSVTTPPWTEVSGLISRKYQVSPWTPLGPSGFVTFDSSGRTNSVCAGGVCAINFDPRDVKTILIGSYAGGVWKTVDGGVNWRATSDFMIRDTSQGRIPLNVGFHMQTDSIARHPTIPDCLIAVRHEEHVAEHITVCFPMSVSSYVALLI